MIRATVADVCVFVTDHVCLSDQEDVEWYDPTVLMFVCLSLTVFV